MFRVLGKCLLVRQMCIRDMTYNEAPNKVQLFFWVELMYYLGFDAFRQVALQFHDTPYDNGELSDEKKWEWVMNAFSTRCV